MERYGKTAENIGHLLDGHVVAIRDVEPEIPGNVLFDVFQCCKLYSLLNQVTNRAKIERGRGC